MKCCLSVTVVVMMSISVFKPKFAEPQRSRDEREDNSDFYSFGPNAANSGFRGKYLKREICIMMCDTMTSSLVLFFSIEHCKGTDISHYSFAVFFLQGIKIIS